MSDYISREALKELFDGIYDCADLVFEPDDQICAKQHSSCGSCRWLETKRAIQKRVMSLPAADVRPVVRGRWKKRMEEKETPYYKSFTPIWSCSECGTEYDPSLCVTSNLCPTCGAEMREES